MRHLHLSGESPDSSEREKRVPSLEIALDVEGVLADSHAATARKSDLLDESHVPPQNYDFNSEEEIEEYMHVSQNVWHNHNHTIPPMEPDLWKAVRRLNRHHTVDILTSRVNVDEQVKEWLAGYNIEYDEFISTADPRSNKTEYGEHDVHIDDSPEVARDVLDARRGLFLVDRPYNRDFGRMTDSRLRRVSGVTEAAEMLCDPEYLSGVRGL